jgi:mannose-1-phosphate guanylyltransferase
MDRSWSSLSASNGGKQLPAVILVGGEGWRMRPLTERTPKPMLPLLGKPLLAYTFDHLRSGGVDRAVLACGYLPLPIAAHFGQAYDGIALDYHVEPEPLGTGGAIRFAAAEAGIRSTFIALNGDSLREASIDVLVDFHRQVGAKATILLAQVPDPSRYGLVRRDARGRVLGFVEKPEPSEIDTDLINAGLYVLEPEVLDLIPPGEKVSIEREVFPRLAAEGSLYALHLPGYWLDVGTPASYLQAHMDLLERGHGIEVDDTAYVSEGSMLVPPVIVGPGVQVEERACLGPYVHVGSRAHVHRCAVARWTAVLPDAELDADSRVIRAIVSPDFGAIRP